MKDTDEEKNSIFQYIGASEASLLLFKIYRTYLILTYF